MTESERIALTMALDSGLPYIGLRDVAPIRACSSTSRRRWSGRPTLFR